MVTNTAPPSAPRSSWPSIVSSACRMRLRSMTPNTERPSPTSAPPAPCSASRASRARRSGVIQEDAALAVADEHALLQLGHQRREAVLFRLDARFRRLDRLVDLPLQLAATLRESVHACSRLSGLLRTLGYDAIVRVRSGDELCGLDEAAHRIDGPVEPAPYDAEDPADERDEEKHQQPDAGRREQRGQLWPARTARGRARRESRRRR